MSGESPRVAMLSRRALVAGAAVTAATVPTRHGMVAARGERRTRRTAIRRQTETISLALTTDDLPRIQPLLADYAAQTGVEVRAQAYPYPQLYQQLNIELTVASCAFDVVSLDDPWMPLFAGGGFLRDLGEVAATTGTPLETTDFVPTFLALGQSAADPGPRALPWIGNVQVFAWRADVLQELGLSRATTWDEVVAVAQAVAGTGRSDLFGVGIRGQPGNSAATTFLPVLRGHGADLFDAAWEPQLTSEAARTAMATLLTLASLAPAGVETIGHEELSRQLYTGQIAQAADIWPNQMLQVSDPELSSVVGKVAIGAEPAQPGAQPASMTGNWLVGIPAGCDAKAGAALDFIRWLTAPEQQKRLLFDQGLPATRVSVLQDQEAVARLPFLPGLLEAAQTAVPRPRTVLYPAIEEILGVWVAKAIAGQTSGDDALQQANDEIRLLLVRERVLPE